MFLNPVFVAELRTSSRRFRFYAGRSAMGLMLLLYLRAIHLAYQAGDDSNDYRAAASLARSVQANVLLAQWAAAIAITPVVVAGSIAGERQRKTLDELLVTGLSSTQIVFGKMFVGLLHVVVFLGVPLPIECVLAPLVGPEPATLGARFLLFAATGLFLGGLSALASSLARGPREAILATYAFVALWLVLPPVVQYPIALQFPAIYGRIEPIHRVLALTNPFTIRPVDSLTSSALLASLGLVLGGVAARVLRPVARRQFVGASRGASKSARHRPPMSDDPMAWKERYAPQRSGWMGVASRLGIAAVVLLLLVVTAILALPDFRWVMVHGYASGYGHVGSNSVNEYLRMIGTASYLLALLASVMAAAGSIGSERDRGSWIGLVATPLDAGEILSAKRLGARRAIRPVVASLVGIWAIGLISGAVHPVGFALSTALAILYLRFGVSLGTYLSLVCSTTARAMGLSLVALFALNGGLFFCCLPITLDSHASIFGITPLLIFLAPMSYRDVYEYLNVPPTYSIHHRGGELLLAVILSILAYGLGAILLNFLAESQFDRAVDRPWRPGNRPVGPRND